MLIPPGFRMRFDGLPRAASGEWGRVPQVFAVAVIAGFAVAVASLWWNALVPAHALY